MKKRVKETVINIGTGKDYSIKEYVKNFLKVIFPKNRLKIIYDKNKPNGTPRKVLNVSLARRYGWRAKTDLNEAILITYREFISRKYK